MLLLVDQIRLSSMRRQHRATTVMSRDHISNVGEDIEEDREKEY